MSDEDRYHVPEGYDECRELLDELVASIQAIETQLGADMDGVTSRDGEWRLRAMHAKNHLTYHYRRVKARMKKLHAEEHKAIATAKHDRKLQNIRHSEARARAALLAVRRFISDRYGKEAEQELWPVIQEAERSVPALISQEDGVSE